MSEQDKRTPEHKALREALYQKKGALQEIYSVTQKMSLPPEEKVSQIETLCKVSGVYIEK